MINLFHVSKAFGNDSLALKDITLKIKKGEFLFVTGPSGAGKSTLLKVMFGAENPTDGQIIIDGRNYSRIPREEIPRLRRSMGFVFQDFKLLPGKTVFDNVAISLVVMGVGKREIKNRVLRILSYLKLQHRINFKPLSLSGGEQQRVAIARALVKEPTIILADEPTGNLDHKLSMETIELFRDVNNRGTTVVIASHDMEIVRKFGSRTIRLETGRLVS
ncbi:MAG: cell division ATP-binding protein FtsE [Thermodesulfobacteriota bacterium]